MKCIATLRRHAAFCGSELDTVMCGSCGVRQPNSRFGCNCGRNQLPVHGNDGEVTWAGLYHRDRVGYTARCIAEELGFQQCVKVLETHGAIGADPSRYNDL